MAGGGGRYLLRGRQQQDRGRCELLQLADIVQLVASCTPYPPPQQMHVLLPAQVRMQRRLDAGRFFLNPMRASNKGTQGLGQAEATM